MIKLVPLIDEFLQENAAMALVAKSAQADLQEFYRRRPDCGKLEEAQQMIARGEAVLAAFVDMETGAYKAALLYGREEGESLGLRIYAYLGRISDYTACGEAVEHYAREIGMKAIMTTTKPSYALQNGKLGYTLESYNWRKNLEE